MFRLLKTSLQNAVNNSLHIMAPVERLAGKIVLKLNCNVFTLSRRQAPIVDRFDDGGRQLFAMRPWKSAMARY